MWTDEFTDTFQDLPAKFFPTVQEADDFTYLLTCLQISFKVTLQHPPRRLRLPFYTVVQLLETDHGSRH
jgi:hypothetical protein